MEDYDYDDCQDYLDNPDYYLDVYGQYPEPMEVYEEEILYDDEVIEEERIIDHSDKCDVDDLDADWDVAPRSRQSEHQASHKPSAPSILPRDPMLPIILSVRPTIPPTASQIDIKIRELEHQIAELKGEMERLQGKRERATKPGNEKKYSRRLSGTHEQIMKLQAEIDILRTHYEQKKIEEIDEKIEKQKGTTTMVYFICGIICLIAILIAVCYQ